MNKSLLYTTFLILLIPICFVCDILFGSVSVPFSAFNELLSGNGTESIWYNIIINLRLPRAMTAILVGIALPISGLLMQTLFKNPLADPYILGVSTGASLGVAFYSLMGGVSLVFFSSFNGSLGTAISALVGSSIIIMLILVIAPKIKNIASLLIIGIMFGSLTSAIVTMLQYFSDPDEVHHFIIWTMGSLANIDKTEIILMIVVIAPIAFATLLIHKPLDAILLGENYAHSLGVNASKIKIVIIVFSTILASIVTAFAGPIGFVGMTIPHIARFLFKTNSHKKLIVNSTLIGINLMLICDLISQLPGTQTMLPINTVTAIFGAPIVILVIYRSRRNNL